MIKTLQVQDPLITTYPHHASLFSMLDMDTRSRSWIYHHFLLVILHHNDEGGYGLDLCSQYYPWHKFKLPTCPMLITRVYEREIILKQWSLQDFLVELIRKDNYIYFLRNMPDGGKHEVFITGFDSDRKVFLCHDFWDGFYGEKWLPYDEITAIEDSNFDTEWSTDYLNGIWAIEKTDEYKQPSEFYYETVLQFTKEDLLDILKEYVGETDHIRTILRKDNRYLGSEIYDKMTEMLDMQKEGMTNMPFAVHPFHLLYEHKQLLSQAILEFFPESSLQERLEELVSEALKLRNLVMYMNEFIMEQGVYKKYNTLLAKIEELKKFECSIMKQVLEKEHSSELNV
ncbi:hypothetical protein M3629_11730 [Paenibacillus polysaccharolyticus]|uniref:hypothetical protein n=1 Tax=Paenibacillus polysaccharolyticus TaxID=582692 RepID=UPI00203FF3A6|nr:hypothetical protein [Paenibacillus polysaccharolyticus]MCM3133468.1 hypothetical protein [Paenibacillus polysaccharolyticus]